MRTRQLTLGIVGSLVVTGCYALQPVAGTVPPEGKRMAFDVSDAGRVALGGAMGPSIARVEGRLLRMEGGEFVVAVTGVNYIQGGSQAWSGETVRLKPGYVGTIYERRLAKARTIAAAALGVGAVAWFATRTLDGGGDVVVRPNPQDSTGVTIKGRMP